MAPGAVMPLPSCSYSPAASAAASRRRGGAATASGRTVVSARAVIVAGIGCRRHRRFDVVVPAALASARRVAPLYQPLRYVKIISYLSACSIWISIPA